MEARNASCRSVAFIVLQNLRRSWSYNWSYTSLRAEAARGGFPGAFGKSAAKATEEKENLSVQLALRAEPKGAESHTSGFEVLPSLFPFLLGNRLAEAPGRSCMASLNLCMASFMIVSTMAA